MIALAYTMLCAAMLAFWLHKTLRLRRQGLFARRGVLVPLGALLLWGGLLGDVPALIGPGIALILIGESWPDVRARRPRKSVPTVQPFARWQAALEPARPDIELHLEETGARVHNVGGTTLFLHGWSPADQNGWLALRADDGSGTPLARLGQGEWARLSPWPMPNRGVRVWYTRQGEAEQQWLFRADWQDVNFGRAGRELN